MVIKKSASDLRRRTKHKMTIAPLADQPNGVIKRGQMTADFAVATAREQCNQGFACIEAQLGKKLRSALRGPDMPRQRVSNITGSHSARPKPGRS